MASPQSPISEPANIAEFIASRGPILPRSTAELLAEYVRKHRIYSDEIGRWSEEQADAEHHRRRKLAEEDPSPENIAGLGQQSPEELRRTYAEKRSVFEGLREACVRQYATPLGREILPIIEKLVAEFRLKVHTEFQAFHHRWRMRYDPHSNPIVQATDRWWSVERDSLRREDWARDARYPHHWERLLPLPDFFVGIVGGNINPVDDGNAPQPAAAAPAAPSPAKTAVGIATARAA